MLAVSLLTGPSCKKASFARAADLKTMTISNPIGPVEFSIEIADNNQTRARGLSHRKSLSPNSGMLFIFDESSRHTFWMKDTSIPLDLIFFDDTLKIIGVVENARPMSLAPLGVKKDSRYVLEVLAGTVKKYGIKENAIGRIVTE